MGWLILILLAAAAMGLALWRGFPKPLWTMLGAALALGGVGYAWQGRPSLPASPPSTNSGKAATRAFFRC